MGREIVFHLLHPDIGVPLHEDLVIEVRGVPNLHVEVFCRNATDFGVVTWKLLVVVV